MHIPCSQRLMVVMLSIGFLSAHCSMHYMFGSSDTKAEGPEDIKHFFMTNSAGNEALFAYCTVRWQINDSPPGTVDLLYV